MVNFDGQMLKNDLEIDFEPVHELKDIDITKQSESKASLDYKRYDTDEIRNAFVIYKEVLDNAASQELLNIEVIESHYDRNTASSANKRQRTRNQHRGNAAKGRERQAAADVRRHSATVSRANKRQRKDIDTGVDECRTLDIALNAALQPDTHVPRQPILSILPTACGESMESGMSDFPITNPDTDPKKLQAIKLIPLHWTYSANSTSSATYYTPPTYIQHIMVRPHHSERLLSRAFLWLPVLRMVLVDKS